jgi:hypothetical protein
LAVLALTNVSDTSTLSKQNEKQAETAKKKCLKPVAVYTELDEIRNAVIREKSDTFTLIDRILKYRSQLKDHVLRMKTGRNPKQILTHRPDGRGRPWGGNQY